MSLNIKRRGYQADKSQGPLSGRISDLVSQYRARIKERREGQGVR